MPLFLFSLHLAIFYLPLSFSEKPIPPNCPCDKIRIEKKCDNPDCIKICNLQHLFNEIDEQIINQCLKDGAQNTIFVLKKAKITQFEAFLKESKNKIAEIETKHKKALRKNCPHCYLLSKISSRFKPKQAEKNCDEKYLQTYLYSHREHLKLKEDETCGKKKRNQIFKHLKRYVKNIIYNSNNNELSKKLYADCPNLCSFDISYTLQIDENNCSGDLDLKVACTHKVKTRFFVPVYDISITYKGGLQCQER